MRTRFDSDVPVRRLFWRRTAMREACEERGDKGLDRTKGRKEIKMVWRRRASEAL
jgi:hypothetical protein